MSELRGYLSGAEKQRLRQLRDQLVRARLVQAAIRRCPGCGTEFYSQNPRRVWCTHVCGARQLHLRKTGRA